MTKSVFTARYARFRQLLVEARVAAALSQGELASRLERPQSYVSKYERGERRLDVVELLEITRVLGIDSAKLLAQLEATPAGDEPADAH